MSNITRKGLQSEFPTFSTPGKRELDKQLARPGKRKTVRQHLLGLTNIRNTFSESSSTPECSVLGEQLTYIGIQSESAIQKENKKMFLVGGWRRRGKIAFPMSHITVHMLGAGDETAILANEKPWVLVLEASRLSLPSAGLSISVL